MYYVIYNKQSGNIIDIDTSIPTELSDSHGMLSNEGSIPDRYFYQWDNTTLQFIPKANIDRTISILQFLGKFTAQERISSKELAKTNPALSDYLDMVNSAQFIDLDDPITFGGLSYLAYLGIISQNRIQEILA